MIWSMVSGKPDLKQQEQFLSRVFPALDETGVQELQQISLPVYYDENELIAQEGSYASGVYIVQSGLVSIGKYSSKGWEKRVLRFLGVGEMFGLESVFLEREPINVQFAKALVESALVFFERSNILAFSKRHPTIFSDLCRWLAREVIMLEYKLTRDAVETIDHNLALLLLALANKYGEHDDLGIVLDLPVSRQTMAEMLGISIETLMRGLKRFRDRGVVATSQSRITLLDADAIKERARATSFYLSIIEETL
jgi:CRP-like cAMP-binding protein